LKLKFGAAVHPNDYLPATARHTPNPIIQNASPWNFCPGNPCPATTTNGIKLKLGAVVHTNGDPPAPQRCSPEPTT